jgi:hypothetical protein
MDLSRRFEGKKFMWDGRSYLDEKQAQDVSLKYQTDGFQTRLINEDKQYYIFTRREIKEVVVEGKPA